MSECLVSMKSGRCHLDAGHSGNHCHKTYLCVSCQKRRRGNPYSFLGGSGPNLPMCFICTKDIRRGELAKLAAIAAQEDREMEALDAKLRERP